MRVPADSKQRQRALDPQTSFICEAPAGSGKTELLTQRVLTLLARVEKPESILSITFTRKAAAEMRERILRALASALGPKPEQQHAQLTWSLACKVLSRDKERDWALLDNPNRLQIRTFDSLCANLTQALPLHSQLGSGVRVGEDPKKLYSEAVTTFLASIDEDKPWSRSLVDLFQHLDNRYTRVEELLFSLLQTRDAWLPLIRVGTDFTELRAVLEGYLESVVKDKMATLVESIEPAVFSELAVLADFAAANLRQEGKSSAIVNLLGIHEGLSEGRALTVDQCQGLAALLLTGQGQWRKKLDKNGGFPSGVNANEKKAFKQAKEEMKALLARLSGFKAFHQALLGVRHWPEPSYRNEQWGLLSSLSRILPVLVAHLQLVFCKYTEVDFLEMSFRAQQALGDEEEPTDLALRLDHQIQHILADEFQDTSHNQLHLLKKLTLGWEQGDGRTLFCVGDAMQSIYGFRSADVGLFLSCKQRGLGNIDLEVLQLTTNFRSQAGVVDWVNKAFSRAFPEQSDISTGAVAYSSSEAFLPQSDAIAAQTTLYDKDCGEIEGELVVDIVRNARQAQPACTIAVLVRGKRHAEECAAALKAAGISFRAVDLEPLASSVVIQDLLSLTKALLYPTDRIAWLSVLRAPWCGLSLADLQVLASLGETPKEALLVEQIHQAMENSSVLSESGARRLQRCGQVLMHALRERQRKPLRLWLEGIWFELGGASCLRSETECENARRFFVCLEELNKDGDLPSDEQLEQAVAELFSAPAPDADPSLQIMTMHKSKGLEFDHVILPGLHKASGRADSPLLLWQERVSRQGQEQWLLAPITAYGEEKDSVYRYLQYEKSVKEQYESCRLLYVACTRARQQLHLLCGVKGIENGRDAIPAPANKCLIAGIWPTVIEDVRTRIVERGDCSEYSAVIENTSLRRLPVEWLPVRVPDSRILADFELPANYDNRNLPNNLLTQPVDVDSARVSGTLVHELLQSVGLSGLVWWRSQNLNALQPAWRARLQTMGLRGGELNEATNRVLTAMQKALQSRHLEWILQGHCQFERAFGSTESDQSSRHVVDVLRFDSSSAVTIVDYKTSSPGVGDSEEAFVEKEKREYRPQMNRYRNLLLGMGYKRVKCLLFFVMIDTCIEC